MLVANPRNFRCSAQSRGITFTYTDFEDGRGIGIPTVEKFELPDRTLLGQNIAVTFGSQLGTMLAGDSIFEQIAGRTVGAIVCETVFTLGNSITTSLLGDSVGTSSGTILANGIGKAFDDIGQNALGIQCTAAY